MVLSICEGVGVAVLAVVGVMVGLGVLDNSNCGAISGELSLEHADRKMNKRGIAIQQNLVAKYFGLSLPVRMVSSDRQTKDVARTVFVHQSTNLGNFRALSIVELTSIMLDLLILDVYCGEIRFTFEELFHHSHVFPGFQ
jgi:hypothetical protein